MCVSASGDVHMDGGQLHGFPGAGVSGGCKLPDVGSGNYTLGPWKSSKCS